MNDNINHVTKVIIFCIFILSSGLAFTSESRDTIAEAQSNFNNKCGHCHGRNGASPISERDLRKLSMRYKEEWKSVTYSTITKGRPDLGMPTWDGILPDNEIKAIVEFLATVQKN